MAEKEIAAVVKFKFQRDRLACTPCWNSSGTSWYCDHGLCKEYNAKTEDKRGQVVPVEITIYADRTFSFITKTPPTSFLLRKAAGLDKASQNPGREMAGSVTDAQITEIAETKLPDLNTNDLDQAKLQVAGTARSMGLEVN